ncbi:unnamed protein product [Acanthoscelides obtectus]|uniref:Uncharacterized protein n=1 Tax=Acanthoscelides obtectus TaxID=200917 RepID=A0A9P0JIL7_ACAOB|nr:unnamed protein product [Acanthoscelides obtectus]CAK1661588.1 hypothetical protein AOBTE_LOCUS22703 [Acanthoscelides obtectus]
MADDNIAKKDVSSTTTNSYLCRKRGYVDINDQKMEPGDADNSHFEEMYQEDRILKILSSSHQSQEVMILYKNENFCHESSNLSCFDDEIQQTSRNTYVIQPDDYREDTVRIIYFRNEQRAEVVLLKKENVIARFWAWCKGKIDCLKPEDPD